MNWFKLLWNDGIDYDKHWNNCDRIKTNNMSKHGLATWFEKHLINHDVVAIDNYNYNKQTLIMEWFKRYE